MKEIKTKHDYTSSIGEIVSKKLCKKFGLNWYKAKLKDIQNVEGK